jgi:Trypsin-like peptidase domain
MSIDLNSIVLIAPVGGGLSSNGTGFVIGSIKGKAIAGQPQPPAAVVVTCSHVVGHNSSVGAENATVTVNGLKPRKVDSAWVIGLDLALLEVEELAAEAIMIGEFRSTDEPLKYFGYTKLYADDYIRARIDVKLGQLLEVRNAVARHSFTCHELTTIGNGLIQSGHSGAPLLSDSQVVGVVSHRLDGNGRGLAISLRDAFRKWEPARQLINIVDAANFSPELKGTSRSSKSKRPYPPLPHLHPEYKADADDRNYGRFVEVSKPGVALLVELKRHSVMSGIFVFDAIIKVNGKVAGRPNSAVQEARFLLHPTFDPDSYIVKRKAGSFEIKLEDVSSYGVFVLGVQVRVGNEFIELGYNLKDLPGLPEEFKRR